MIAPHSRYQLRIERWIVLIAAVALLSACPRRDRSLYRFGGDGRLPGTEQSEAWIPHQPSLNDDALQGAAPPPNWTTARERHIALLKRRKDTDGEAISVADRQRVIEALREGLASFAQNKFRLLRLRGDGTSNVQFTGYYTPIIEARRQPDERFKHALYAMPPDWKGAGPHLSRGQIDDEGKLAGRGLELAYTADPSDNFFMQVQGSGLVRYQDGSTEMLAYAGKNGHKYVSVGRLLVERGVIDKSKISMNSIRAWCAAKPADCHKLYNENPSFVFFRRGPKGPVGAAGEIVSGGVSIAVDPRIIPLGSTLLARVPVLGEDGMVALHEFRMLLAQDTGGAIKGTAHIDLYMGIGPEAAALAQNLHHYGQLWLILPPAEGGNSEAPKGTIAP